MNIENILLKDILNNNTLYEVEEDTHGKLQYKLDDSGEKIRICEIDEIEWDTNFNNVDDVCSFIGKGKTPKYVDYSSIQVIKSGQARGMYEFDLSTKYYTDEDKLSYDDERILKRGDLVINTTGVGTVGRVTAYILKDQYHTPDSHMCIMRSKENISFRYLLLNFVGIGFKNLEKMAEGTGGQIELGIGKIKSISILVPKENKYNGKQYSTHKLQESIAKNIEEKINDIDRKYKILEKIEMLNNMQIEKLLHGIYNNCIYDEIKVNNTYIQLKNIEWDENISFSEFYKPLIPPCKIQNSELKEIGNYPVVSQSKGLINGYIDKKDGLIEIEDKPLIIFGDHTTIIKYIDFDFFAGADGTKILKTLDSIYSKYAYYSSLFRIQSSGYQRHFTLFKKIEFKLPKYKNINSYDLQKEMSNYIDTKITEIKNKDFNTNNMKKILDQLKEKIIEPLLEKGN